MNPLQEHGEVKEKKNVDPSIYSKLVRADISHGAFRLWHLLRDHMNYETGRAFPAQETIAKGMHCKVGSLKVWTEELTGPGFLQAEKKGQDHHWVYTFPVAFPKWAGRQDSGSTQKGNPTSPDLPIGEGRGPAPMGRQTEGPKEPIDSISNSIRAPLMKPELIHFLQDVYILDKIAGNQKLNSELREGKTKLSKQLKELYSRGPQKVRELICEGMKKDFPAKWLNISVTNEITGGWSKPKRAGAPDRNAGTYNARTSIDGLKAKIL